MGDHSYPEEILMEDEVILIVEKKAMVNNETLQPGNSRLIIPSDVFTKIFKKYF